MAKVICTGVAFLDHVFEVDRDPVPEGKTFARDFGREGGGMAATAAVAAARLGGFAAFWGRLGSDDTGEIIVRQLARFGVDVSSVRLIRDAQSPVSAIIVRPDGERQAVVFPGFGLNSDTTWLPLAQIEDANAVLVDPRWPEAARTVLEKARHHNLPAVLDGEVGPDPISRDLVARASHTVFSQAGLVQYTGLADMADGLVSAAHDTDGMVAVTAGANGVYWLEQDGDIRHLPALDIHAVDTHAAGDVFHGAFALALGEDKDIETAMRFANVAAGLKCARIGGREAIPRRAEVWGILAPQGDRSDGPGPGPTPPGREPGSDRPSAD